MYATIIKFNIAEQLGKSLKFPPASAQVCI